MGTRRTNYCLILFIGLGLLAPQHGISQSDMPALAIHRLSDNRLSMRINRSTKLREVLQRFCQQTQTSCDLPAEGLDELSPALTLIGSSGELVNHLLEGAKVNYSFLPPTSKEQGHLIITTKIGSSEIQAMNFSSRDSNPSRSDSTQVPRSMQKVQESEPVLNAIQGSESTVLLSVPSSGEIPTGMNFVPFPGSDGRPMMQAITNEDLTIAPFLDPDGKPIPMHVTNEPPSYLPFFDNQGRPIPAPPIIPNQKLDFPIPPTSPR